jgi:hypothetical protein
VEDNAAHVVPEQRFLPLLTLSNLLEALSVSESAVLQQTAVLPLFPIATSTFPELVE